MVTKRDKGKTCGQRQDTARQMSPIQTGPLHFKFPKHCCARRCAGYLCNVRGRTHHYANKLSTQEDSTEMFGDCVDVAWQFFQC